MVHVMKKCNLYSGKYISFSAEKNGFKFNIFNMDIHPVVFVITIAVLHELRNSANAAG